MQLTSAKNPQLQKIRRAATGGRPTEEGWVVAEGPHLVEEALKGRGRWRVEQIVATVEARANFAPLIERARAEVVEVSPRAMETIADTECSQGILALLKPPAVAWHDLTSSRTLLLILDGIQDPGNVGTIIRSAEAFGASGVILLKGCPRISNGKLLRATAGSIFRVPSIEDATASEAIDWVRKVNLKLYGLAVGGSVLIGKADLRAGCALAVGSEGRGLSAEILRRAEAVSIPISQVESLNAAVACSIALFEAQRQRTEE